MPFLCGMPILVWVFINAMWLLHKLEVSICKWYRIPLLAITLGSKISQGISGGTTGGRRGAYAPQNRPASAMLCSRNLHDTASKPYVDQEMDIRTFYVTQDRENPTDSA